MKTFSIREAIKHGWRLFKSHKEALIVSFVALMVVQIIGDNLSKHWLKEISIIVAVAFWIIGSILQIGFQKLVLKINDGENPDWREIFRHSEILFKYLVTTFLLVVATVIGLVLLIIPGFYIMLTYGLAPIILVDKNTTISEAFSRSRKLTYGGREKLFEFYVAVFGLCILGFLALFVGIIVAAPVSALATAFVYRSLERQTGETV